MEKEFLQRMDDPEDEKLNELLKVTITDCKEKLNKENVEFSKNNIKKFASTFYYDWEKDGKPKYVFLIQNPGPLQRDRPFGKEIYELKESDSHIERVRVNREYLKTWLFKKNRNFSRKFLSTLKNHGLIEFEDSWQNYIENGEIFKDFYVTDLVKYRTKTEKIEDKKGGNAEVSYDDFLKKEISFIQPELLFVFGRRPWKILRRKRNLIMEDEMELSEEDLESVTKVHGYLFKDRDIGMNIIPLAHFSGRNHFLRDSYYRYLGEGLSKREK